MRARWFAVFLGCALLTVPLAVPLACGGTAGPSPVTPASSASTKASDDRSGFSDKDISAYRSNRLGLTMPLPDRAGWSITDRDDALAGWLQATHVKTSSIVRARKFEEGTAVGRHECELRAQLSGELPKDEQIEKKHFETLRDEAVHRPKGWDGRRWVAFEPRPGGKLGGHVFLMAGKGRTCLVVHASLEVKSDTEANELADRLELFDARVVLAVTVDSAEAPGPISPDFPKLPPTPGVP